MESWSGLKVKLPIIISINYAQRERHDRNSQSRRGLNY